MAYFKNSLTTTKKLTISVAITAIIFAGVYYVFQNYDALFNRSQENVSVNAAQAALINAAYIDIAKLSQKELEEVVSDMGVVGVKNIIVKNTFLMEKNCSTKSWKVTPYYADGKLWALLKLAVAQKQEVYVGLADLQGSCTDVTKNDTAAVISESKNQLQQLLFEASNRGYANRFAGVYIPQNAQVAALPAFDNYYTNMAAVVKQQNKQLKVMIAPYRGLQSVENMELTQSVITQFVEHTLVDIIIPQVSMGTEYYLPISTNEYLMVWRDAIDKSHKSVDLWASIEVFDKLQNKGNQVFQATSPSSLISRVDATLPYVSTIVADGYQQYMAQSALLVGTDTKENAIARFNLRAGYLMHYVFGRNLVSATWKDGNLTVLFTDKKYDGTVKTSLKIAYLTVKGQYKTAVAIRAATKVTGQTWKVVVSDVELAQVYTKAPIGVLIRTVAANEQSIKID